MTREEAINWLDRLYMGADITDEYGDMVDMQPYEEAFNMAIKALEQNDVLDKIKAEITENAYPIVHGVNNRELGMTLY